MTEELRRLNLDLYDTGAGLWNENHGLVEIPPDWAFLPSGDRALTRAVKAGGVYWTGWQPKSRHRRRRRLLGIWAPKTAVDDAQAQVAQAKTQVAQAKTQAAQAKTQVAQAKIQVAQAKIQAAQAKIQAAQAKAGAKARAEARPEEARRRADQERRAREDLAAAVLEFLDFAPEHAGLAGRIARTAAGHATVATTARPLRSRTLGLAERAAIAARTTIRHQYTDYDNTLEALTVSDFWDDESLYREAGAKAHGDVDAFLREHRRAPSPPAG